MSILYKKHSKTLAFECSVYSYIEILDAIICDIIYVINDVATNYQYGSAVREFMHSVQCL